MEIDGLQAGTFGHYRLDHRHFCPTSAVIAIFSSTINVMISLILGSLWFSLQVFTAPASIPWYQCISCPIFMGDTGSLMLGGVMPFLALTLRKELLLPLMCGIFLIETTSGSMISGWATSKYTKKRIRWGKRVFLMSPIHPIITKSKNIPEAKIVTRFWIVGFSCFDSHCDFKNLG